MLMSACNNTSSLLPLLLNHSCMGMLTKLARALLPSVASQLSLRLMSATKSLMDRPTDMVGFSSYITQLHTHFREGNAPERAAFESEVAAIQKLQHLLRFGGLPQFIRLKLQYAWGPAGELAPAAVGPPVSASSFTGNNFYAAAGELEADEGDKEAADKVKTVHSCNVSQDFIQ
jgi:hypothetical protein